MKKKNQMVKRIELAITGAARRFTGDEANTACSLWDYQHKKPDVVEHGLAIISELLMVGMIPFDLYIMKRDVIQCLEPA